MKRKVVNIPQRSTTWEKRFTGLRASPGRGQRGGGLCSQGGQENDRGGMGNGRVKKGVS